MVTLIEFELGLSGYFTHMLLFALISLIIARGLLIILPFWSCLSVVVRTKKSVLCPQPALHCHEQGSGGSRCAHSTLSGSLVQRAHSTSSVL